MKKIQKYLEKRMKKLCSVAMLFGLVVGLSACNSGGNGGGDNPPASSGSAHVTITNHFQ